MLTAQDKLDGRVFRAECQARLAELPSGSVAFCPPFIVWYRHKCSRSSTWALSLRQHYWQRGLFAFIWREGTCPRCGFTVRSATGRFCLASENPPEKGAVVARH